jgi:hypothetical protein
MSEYAIINTCYGGFGVSEKARTLMGLTKAQIYQIARNDKLLVDVVRRLGEEASDKHAKLVAVKLKPATKYVIYEFDGMEYISEDHKIFDHKQNKWVFASKTIDTSDFVIATIKTK